MQSEHTCGDIESCGDMRDAGDYSMETSMTDEPALELAKRPIMAFNDIASKISSMYWRTDQFASELWPNQITECVRNEERL